MTCPCNKRVQTKLERYRVDARSSEGKLRAKLDTFREGITAGAEELASRHLYRAGIYLASLDNSYHREPDTDMVIDSLKAHLSDEAPELYRFFLSKKESIISQGMNLEPTVILRKVLRRKEKEGLIRANAINEITSAKRSLERAERLKERLKTWHEGIHVQIKPEAICIADLHTTHQTSE